MLGLAARLIGGMLTPLIDQVSASSARLLRKLALFAVAALSMVVVLIALTIALDLWVASMKGPIAGALAVAGLYLAVALVAGFVALRPVSGTRPASGTNPAGASKPDTADATTSDLRDGLSAQIDEFTAPILAMLQKLGLRREQLAVLAGSSVAKQIGPIPLVGLAIVAGFLVGRMWRGLFSTDLLTSLLASDLLAGLLTGKDDESEAEPAERDAA